ncbi:MAG: CvpA family protein [Desulfobacteraceae bacterium]|nr:MAG: CvpA family protein [Desulfobacteraceae bacterium]
MNILDFIILGLITFFVIKGIFRGFFREISSLAGIIFGIWIGNHYHPQMANLLKTYIPLEKFLPLISIIILFISVVILFNLFGILLHHLFKRLFIGWFDRGLGIGFALIKGIIISYLLIVLLTFFMPSKSPLIAKSTAARTVIVTYQSMSRLISPDLYKTWKKRIYKESKKVGKVISEGKEAVKKIPQVLPDKKE